MVYGTNSFYNLKHASLTYMPKKPNTTTTTTTHFSTALF